MSTNADSERTQKAEWTYGKVAGRPAPKASTKRVPPAPGAKQVKAIKVEASSSSAKTTISPAPVRPDSVVELIDDADLLEVESGPIDEREAMEVSSSFLVEELPGAPGNDSHAIGGAEILSEEAIPEHVEMLESSEIQELDEVDSAHLNFEETEGEIVASKRGKSPQLLEGPKVQVQTPPEAQKKSNSSLHEEALAKGITSYADGTPSHPLTPVNTPVPHPTALVSAQVAPTPFWQKAPFLGAVVLLVGIGGGLVYGQMNKGNTNTQTAQAQPVQSPQASQGLVLTPLPQAAGTTAPVATNLAATAAPRAQNIPQVDLAAQQQAEALAAQQAAAAQALAAQQAAATQELAAQQAALAAQQAAAAEAATQQAAAQEAARKAAEELAMQQAAAAAAQKAAEEAAAQKAAEEAAARLAAQQAAAEKVAQAQSQLAAHQAAAKKAADELAAAQALAAQLDGSQNTSKAKTTSRKTRTRSAANNVSKAKAEPGVLMLAAKPPAQIFVDGKKTGLSTPQRNLKLAAGKHKIVLINREHRIRDSFSVTISADKTTKIVRDNTDKLK